MTNYRKQLETAIRAALLAGSHFAAALHVSKQVSTKSSPADLVTEYDAQCESMIERIILEAFPDDEILGEENTAPGSEASRQAAQSAYQSERLWVIDPLDGTTNFVYQLPLSVVSIAYAEVGVVKVGVVYDPYREEGFAAVDGSPSVRFHREEAQGWLQQWDGAEEVKEADTREWQLPGVTLQASTRTGVRGAVLATGFPPRTTSRHLVIKATLELTEHVKNLRALGAAALHLAYVAAGRLDGFWEYDLNAWDLAAGCFLVQQAGGFVRGLDGRTYSLLTRDIVVAGSTELIEDIIGRVTVSVNADTADGAEK